MGAVFKTTLHCNFTYREFQIIFQHQFSFTNSNLKHIRRHSITRYGEYASTELFCTDIKHLSYIFDIYIAFIHLLI